MQDSFYGESTVGPFYTSTWFNVLIVNTDLNL